MSESSLPAQRTSQGRVGGALESVQRPRVFLGKGSVEIGEKFGVGKVPATTGGVGHGVDGPGI